MRRLFSIFFFIFSVGGFTACGSAIEDDPSALKDDTNAAERLELELVGDLSAAEALSVLSQDGLNPEVGVTINWPYHTSHVQVPAGTVETQIDWLLAYQKDRLQFLRDQFDANDKDDEVAIAELDEASEIVDDDELPISALDVDVEDVSPDTVAHESVAGTHVYVESDEESSNSVDAGEYAEKSDAGVSVNMLAMEIDISQEPYDFPQDAAWVPKQGTSLIWEAGTLQKFRFDKESKQALVDNKAGFEIKTLITPRTAGDCGSDWDTNFPKEKRYAYLDTDRFDLITQTKDNLLKYGFKFWEIGSSDYHRVCGVGHVKPKLFEVDKRYWAWRSFKDFKKDQDPIIRIFWVPTRFTSALTRDNLLNIAEKAVLPQDSSLIPVWQWLVYSRDDMPTQGLTQYHYSKAPEGQQVHWVKTK